MSQRRATPRIVQCLKKVQYSNFINVLGIKVLPWPDVALKVDRANVVDVSPLWFAVDGALVKLGVLLKFKKNNLAFNIFVGNCVYSPFRRWC